MTLRKRLQLYFIIIAVVPTVLFSIHFYLSSRTSMLTELCESNYKVACHLMDSIDAQFSQASGLTDWICFDRAVGELLRRDQKSSALYDYNKQQVLEHLDNQFSYLPVTEYIPALFIQGKNGLDLRRGIDAQLISPKSFQDTWWFQEAVKSEDKAVWGTIYRQEGILSEPGYVLPLVRGIQDSNSRQILGYMVVLYSRKLFANQMKSFEFSEDERVYCIDARGNILYSNLEEEVGRLPDKLFGDIRQARQDGLRYKQVEKDGIPYMAVFTFSELNSWGVVEMIPLTFVQQQRTMLLKTVVIAAFLIVVVGILVSVYLTANFTKPLETISAYAREVSKGRFDTALDLKGNDEIARLGQNITKMVEKINQLMEDSIHREREKHNLKIEMLQQQINPHFLYNTLNSIQWMAALQGAEGIRHAVGSLGQLLQYGLRDSMAQVELRQELKALEEYIYIQNIRYKGKIIYESQVQDSQILDCRIPKLILQPLVENAIFHGIEPRVGMGRIVVSAECSRNVLYLHVWDNGIGMSADEMDRLLTDKDRKAGHDRLNGIGVANIHERLHILYGPEYGISFESRQGEYTRATLRLPAEWSGQKEEAVREW